VPARAGLSPRLLALMVLHASLHHAGPRSGTRRSAAGPPHVRGGGAADALAARACRLGRRLTCGKNSVARGPLRVCLPPLLPVIAARREQHWYEDTGEAWRQQLTADLLRMMRCIACSHSTCDVLRARQPNTPPHLTWPRPLRAPAFGPSLLACVCDAQTCRPTPRRSTASCAASGSSCAHTATR
jgi:hypothetical protein